MRRSRCLAAIMAPMPRRPPDLPKEEAAALSLGVAQRLAWVVELIYEARPDLNQTRLAEMFNADQSTWNKYLRGTRLPSVANMARFCDAFGVSLDYLYRGRLDASMKPELVIHLLRRHPELGSAAPLPGWASQPEKRQTKAEA